MSTRDSFKDNRPDYRFIGIDGKLYARGFDRVNYETALKLLNGNHPFYNSHPMHSRLIMGFESKKDLNIIMNYFEDSLPIWMFNCTLLAKNGEILTNVSCDERHHFIGEYIMRRYNFEKPDWVQLVPGK